METTVFKRSVVVRGKKTSLSLEDVFWDMLKDIARRRGIGIGDIVEEINSDRKSGTLSSAIRVYVFKFCRDEMLRHEQKS
jgi:predicted DNA-binding ribbon-helix-helix protein